MNLLPKGNKISSWEYLKNFFSRKGNVDFDQELGLAVEARGIKSVLRKIWKKWKG